MDKMVFDKDKKKSSFSSFIAVKKLKIGIHSLLAQAQQTIFFLIFHFMVTVKFSDAKLKRNISKSNLEIWHNMACVQFISSKITPP